MSDPRATADVRLGLLRGGRARGESVPTGHLALVCAVWIAIVWLLFASFVDAGQDGKSKVERPAAGLRQPLQPGVTSPSRPSPNRPSR